VWRVQLSARSYPPARSGQRKATNKFALPAADPSAGIYPCRHPMNDQTSPAPTSAPFTVVVASDLSGASGYAFAQAIEVARRVPGSEVHLVHVVPADTTPEAARDLAGRVRMYVHDKALAIGGLEGQVVGAHVRRGDPVRELVQFAEDVSAALMVLGVHKGPHLRSLLLGSIAEKLVAAAPCAVLVAGPKPQPTAHEPAIEPPCPQCVELRRASAGKHWWCPRHEAPSLAAHVYSYRRELPFGMHDSEVTAIGVDQLGHSTGWIERGPAPAPRRGRCPLHPRRGAAPAPLWGLCPIWCGGGAAPAPLWGLCPIWCGGGAAPTPPAGRCPCTPAKRKGACRPFSLGNLSSWLCDDARRCAWPHAPWGPRVHVCIKLRARPSLHTCAPVTTPREREAASGPSAAQVCAKDGDLDLTAAPGPSRTCASGEATRLGARNL
jgi:nucleotide-binding universal stress UspA family protein